VVGICLCGRPQGGGRALKLGGKKDVESFVDQLKSEGESMFCFDLFFVEKHCTCVHMHTNAKVWQQCFALSDALPTVSEH